MCPLTQLFYCISSKPLRDRPQTGITFAANGDRNFSVRTGRFSQVRTSRCCDPGLKWSDRIDRADRRLSSAYALTMLPTVPTHPPFSVRPNQPLALTPIIHANLINLVTLQLHSQLLQQMRSHAERTYPNECCGLMVGTLKEGCQVMQAVWPVENDWNETVAAFLEDDPSVPQTRRYWIDPQTLLTVMKSARQSQLDIIGVYHSHPDHPAVPSECDRQLAWPHYSYLIVSVQQGQAQTVNSWRLNEQHQFEPEAIACSDTAPLVKLTPVSLHHPPSLHSTIKTMADY